MPSHARRLLTAAGRLPVGCCAVLAAAFLLFGNRGLESAIANGDTRTLTMHHIHTEEDITITYKRDGRYDEDALKQLDWFLRDWRKEESIHMDPKLLDVVWEASREVAGDKTIHVVCGYRSPATNAMLRRRSNGVARFSQHMLGKAMDFYIPGASLEELRYAGLRLQRGGVGYYPTSGAPFVHLDVGEVRHWPGMTHEELARVFPNGRTVHVPSDGRPLSGYGLALADIEKRGSSAPSQTSLAAAREAGIEAAHPRQKSLIATLFGRDDDEDARQETAAAPMPAPAAAAANSAAPRSGAFTLASAKSEPRVSPAIRMPTARPARAPAAFAETPVATAPAVAVPLLRSAVAATPTPPPLAETSFAAAPTTPAPHLRTAAAAKPALATDPEVTASTMPWPVRTAADNDRVPLDMVLAYATQPQLGHETSVVARPEPMGESAARAANAAIVKVATPRANVTTITKKPAVRPAASGSGGLVQRPELALVIANAGMRYDDPWLRAMMLAPSLSDSMTAMLYGPPDVDELRALMSKPRSLIAMSFDEDPYPGITSDRFRGEAVVFLTTYTFGQRTASLR